MSMRRRAVLRRICFGILMILRGWEASDIQPSMKRGYMMIHALILFKFHSHVKWC
jgi:hypothetical protein